MKVGVLAPRIYSHGGVSRVILEIIKELETNENLSFEILTTRIKGDWSEQVESKIIKHSPLPYPELAYFRPDIKRKLSDYDLLWNHNIYLNKLASKTDTPFISTFHPPHTTFSGFLGGYSSKRNFDLYLNKKGTRYLSFPDRVVGISNYMKDRLSEHYNANAVRIYHGGDLTGADFSDKDKEFALSIQAHNAVARDANRIHIKAVGNPDHPNINSLGSLSDQELVKNYKRCSFIVSGSFREGFGMSPVEAAFCGKPSVVRSIGGHKETVVHGETGFLAENSKEFHEYINLLWQDKKLREEMGRNAYEHVKDKFTWERAAKEYLEEFNDLKSHR